MDTLLVACRPCWLVRQQLDIGFAFWKKFESCFIVRHRAIGLPQPSNSFSAVFQDWLFLTLHLLPLHHDHFHSLSTFNASRLSQIQGARGEFYSRFAQIDILSLERRLHLLSGELVSFAG